MFDIVKRIFLGRPIATEHQEHQRISKKVALAVFSSDAISSTSYATQEILFVTAVGASSLALGLDILVPIAIAVAVLIAVVVFSYRQTIYAYPQGGGSYMVSKENLGKYAALVAGASLMVDYVLTVAVSISEGTASITSIPALHSLQDHKVLIAVAVVILMTLLNLRGVKESGKALMAPTYIYMFMVSLLIIYGLGREYFGDLPPIPPPSPEDWEGARVVGGSLTLLVILRGFSSGAVALTGIEAIADGVPVFEKPEAKNASRTLIWMAGILETLFFGVSVLAHHLGPYPDEHNTVFSQMGEAVFGNGLLYLILQFSTAGILCLAANTAYADFPRLSSIIARDGYLPRQLANRGDRLVFSNGIVFLALGAMVLIVSFQAETTALIPLYAVGVFTSFTLSQSGMFRRLRSQGLKSAWVSGFGALCTLAVLLIVATTKFLQGSWVSIVAVATIVAIFLFINRHYSKVQKALAVTPESVKPEPMKHTVVVLVGRLHRGVLKAIRYAKSLNADNVVALYISNEAADQQHMLDRWEQFGINIPLEIVRSPYRELIEPVEAFLQEVEDRWGADTVTVVIPEFVVEHWYENILHNQTALQLKLALLDRRGTVVTSVPYHLKSREQLQQEGITEPTDGK